MGLPGSSQGPRAHSIDRCRAGASDVGVPDRPVHPGKAAGRRSDASGRRLQRGGRADPAGRGAGRGVSSLRRGRRCLGPCARIVHRPGRIARSGARSGVGGSRSGAADVRPGSGRRRAARDGRSRGAARPAPCALDHSRGRSAARNGVGVGGRGCEHPRRRHRRRRSVHVRPSLQPATARGVAGDARRSAGRERTGVAAGLRPAALRIALRASARAARRHPIPSSRRPRPAWRTRDRPITRGSRCSRSGPTRPRCTRARWSRTSRAPASTSPIPAG